MEPAQEIKLSKKERRALKRQERQKEIVDLNKKKSVSKILWMVIGLVVVALGLWGITQLGKQTTPSVISDIPTNQIVVTDHVKGATESAVLFVEYSDFQCPACAQYQPIINQAYEQNKEKVAFVFRNFPLRNGHKNAQLAAQAAEAASRQNSFWEYHDLLYERQDLWADESDPTELFVGYATELGIDAGQFRTDLTTQSVIDKVNNDFNSGVAAGVNGTPTFFLNGEKLTNLRSAEDFTKAIDQANTN